MRKNYNRDAIAEARKSNMFKLYSIYYWFKIRLEVLLYRIKPRFIFWIKFMCVPTSFLFYFLLSYMNFVFAYLIANAIMSLILYEFKD